MMCKAETRPTSRAFCATRIPSNLRIMSMPMATRKRHQGRPSVLGVLTMSLLVAFVLLIVAVAIFGMDDMMVAVHRMMIQIGM